MSQSEFFRFLFSGTLDKERASTSELYQQLQAIYANVDLDEDDIDTDAHYVIEKACRQQGIEVDSIIARQLKLIVMALMIQSELYSLPENISGDMQFDLETDSHNRQLMQRKIQLFEQPDLNRQQVLNDLSTLMGGVFAALPSAMLDLQHTSSAPQFDVPVLDVMEQPAELIESLLGVFLAHNRINLPLFYPLKKQLQANHQWVSDNIKKDALPRDVIDRHGLSSVVQWYLHNTPLAELFTLTLPFSMPSAIRFEHTLLVAGSGHGKTQTIQHMLWQDINAVMENQMGFAVIDSQGDLIQTVTHLSVMKDLQDKVIIVDPNDIEYPPALNMFDAGLDQLDHLSLVDREKIINGTIDLYEYIFSSLLGAELTQKQGVIFKYLARIMLIIPGATIHTLRELVEGQETFSQYFDQLDPSSQHFFKTQFYSKNFRATRQQVLTRLWGVLSNAIFERMFSAPKNKINLFEAMNQGKIVLINTAKDLLKKEGCSIFGRFFIAMMAQAALSRTTLPKYQRMPFFVYIDEAHDYFDEQIEDIANQARKYNVGLVLSHQNLDQMSPHLRATLMSSTSTKLVGGVSAKDALTFAQNMHCSTDDILAMKKGHDHTVLACYLRNITPKPITLTIPFGTLEAQAQLTALEYQQLMDANRRIVSHVGDAPEAGSQDHNDHAAQYKRADEDSYVHHESYHDDAAAQETSTQYQDKEKTAQKSDDISGKGGERHVAIQQQIRRTAHELGLGADIEYHIGEGMHIDIVISTATQNIAVEISISSSAQHECRNIEKCITAGFSTIWIIAETKNHLQAIRHAVEQLDRMTVGVELQFLLPDQAIEELSTMAAPNRYRGRELSVSWASDLNHDQVLIREAAFSRFVL